VWAGALTVFAAESLAAIYKQATEAVAIFAVSPEILFINERPFRAKPPKDVLAGGPARSEGQLAPRYL
jgi:hypothetical protein